MFGKNNKSNSNHNNNKGDNNDLHDDNDNNNSNNDHNTKYYEVLLELEVVKSELMLMQASLAPSGSYAFCQQTFMVGNFERILLIFQCASLLLPDSLFVLLRVVLSTV